MSEIAKRLTDRRLNLVSEMRGVVDTATEENRDFSAEETGRLAAIDEEIDRVDKRLAGVLEQEKRAVDTEEQFKAIRGEPEPKTPDGEKRKKANGELRAFLQGEGPRALEIQPSGTDFRDLSKLSAGAGANTVPTSFFDRLVAHLIETAAMLQTNPTVLTTASGESLQIPKTTAHSTAVIEGETDPIAESDPAFGQVTLTSFKYAHLIQVSRELITDTGVDLEGYLAMQSGRALGNAFGQDLVTGTGSGEPRGVILDASPGVTGPVGTTVTFGNQSAVGQGFDLLISLFHSVISPYRMSSSCAWLMNDTTASLVRRIKSTDGVYAWQPSLVAGEPDMILGKPVVIDPNVASPAASAESIAFGDWSQYFVRMVGGVRFERSDDFAFANDLVTFRAILRGDGALVDLTGAIKTFAHSAT